MKICLVDARHPSPIWEAAALYVPQLIPALAEAHQVTGVTVGAAVHEQPAASSAIRRVIDRDRPQILHLNNLAGLPLATVMWAAGTHTPIAVSLHDRSLLSWPADINRWLTGRVGLVISPTHHLLNEHVEHGFFRHAIQQVLPYGLEPSPPPRPRGDAFDVFFLDPSMSREARRARLERADCLVLPSREPGSYLLTIQEAFQSGAVVIAGRVGGLSEIVHDGVNGMLVEPGDHAAIDTAIRRLHDSPELRARLRTAAAETARHYDIRFHIAGLTDAYRRLLIASRAGDLDRPAA